ncbi:hypothetical protein RIF29_14529 [Crotalaria pallida]|uniref:Uncharacterized protein n=1 Tax=Crotalaria pallida TaxID=3830 RepID=A0AAN9FHX1_CROPI
MTGAYTCGSCWARGRGVRHAQKTSTDVWLELGFTLRVCSGEWWRVVAPMIVKICLPVDVINLNAMVWLRKMQLRESALMGAILLKIKGYEYLAQSVCLLAASHISRAFTLSHLSRDFALSKRSRAFALSHS